LFCSLVYSIDNTSLRMISDLKVMWETNNVNEGFVLFSHWLCFPVLTSSTDQYSDNRWIIVTPALFPFHIHSKSEIASRTTHRRWHDKWVLTLRRFCLQFSLMQIKLSHLMDDWVSYDQWMILTIIKIRYTYFSHFDTKVVHWLADWGTYGKPIPLNTDLFIISMMFETEFLTEIIINQHIGDGQSFPKRQIRLFCSPFSKSFDRNIHWWLYASWTI
jgi:hypothetical protein